MVVGLHKQLPRAALLLGLAVMGPGCCFCQPHALCHSRLVAPLGRNLQRLLNQLQRSADDLRGESIGMGSYYAGLRRN